MPDESAFLVVCSANVCRSPLYEIRLASALATIDRSIGVQSAGLAVSPGEPVCAAVQARLGHPTAHLSAGITMEAVSHAVMVITADREQRSAVNRFLPGVQSKTFTMRETASLSALLLERDDIPRSIRELPEALNAVRGVRIPVQARRRHSDDPMSIHDTHGASGLAHRAMLREVDDAAQQFIASLRRIGVNAAA